MQEFQQYKTIKRIAEFIYKDKGSEFIAKVFPVENERDYQEMLNEIKKKYYDASHYCFCVKLINGFIKYSDDGEPPGTAGIRILNAIDHFGLTNLLVAVIRYFGGTKLGVGPLGKAYYTAAESLLRQSEQVEKKLYLKFFITVDFNFISNVHRILNLQDAKILNTFYKDKVEFEILVEPAKAELICFQVTEATKGSVKIFNPKEKFFL